MIERIPLITKLISQRKDYQTAKAMFTEQYGVLSKYFYQMHNGMTGYTEPNSQGEFLNDGSITENEGAKAAKRMASAIVGATWKGAENTLRIKPVKGMLVGEEEKAYFAQINTEHAKYVDRDKSNFLMSFSSSVLDAIIYGTGSVVDLQGDYTVPLRFQSRAPISIYLGYNKFGDIDSVIIDYYFTAKELVDRYGAVLVGNTVADAYRREDQVKRFILSQTIVPRTRAEGSPDLGALSMPFASYIFLPEHNVFLEEGGFESLPLKVLFFHKLDYESYGRGYGMDALPTVIQSGIAAEILAVGGEATAIPPMAMYNDGTFGGKTINLSAGAMNVFNMATQMFPTEKPIFPIYATGDMTVIFEWWKILRERIQEYFLLDKLYDLNNQNQQTYGEALIRNSIRSDALSLIFTQVMLYLNSLTERNMDILYAMGLLGVADPNDVNDPKVVALMNNGMQPIKIPDSVLKLMELGQDWYEIEHLSPAARIMRTEELQAVTMYLQLIAQAATVDIEFLDCIDPDGTSEKLKNLLSTDLIMLRTEDGKKERRDFRRQMQMEAAKVEAERIRSQTNQSNAQAAAAQTGALRNMLGTEGATGGQL